MNPTTGNGSQGRIKASQGPDLGLHYFIIFASEKKLILQRIVNLLIAWLPQFHVKSMIRIEIIA